jgi:hypothetical protein
MLRAKIFPRAAHHRDVRLGHRVRQAQGRFLAHRKPPVHAAAQIFADLVGQKCVQRGLGHFFHDNPADQFRPPRQDVQFHQTLIVGHRPAVHAVADFG